ncbi:hypothetical protein [Conexibacter sp. DBS9H8]|uniref:hypothetical protein n=1 Tax=Conexibacter sp. DBS9H8 TaxID=2937801 RepID=UPI00200C4738|nr:hypothetical protein [Conexibacter sp. DBS9H8]
MKQPRAFLWPILLIGVAMVIAPFAMSLPSKAAAGQRMMNNFHPIMQPASVRQTAAYYSQTFVPLRAVAIGGTQAAAEVPKMVSALAKPLHMTPAGVEQFLATSFPAMGGLLSSLPKLVPIFTKVPPGLDHYKPLVATMTANVANYAAIDSLVNFRLFTWFFLVPGVLLVLLAGWPLLMRREPSASHPRAVTT